MKQLSIVIPYLNDPDTLIGTIESIYDTIDVFDFEVVVVNDGSSDPLPKDYKLPPNAKHIDHFVNIGVGQAFDTGVRVAQSENIILVGADIRFFDNGWASRMLKVINKHQKAFVCATCVSHATGEKRYGADVAFYTTQKNLTKQHPRFHDETYRAIMEGKWRPRTGRGVYPIPSLMGTFYGVKKDWYNHVRGFELHYKWGVLEPYVSLKTWRMGGEILIDTDNSAMHIWRKPSRETDLNALSYNQQMISRVVFGREGKKYGEFLWEARSAQYERGAEMCNDKRDAIGQLAGYIADHAALSVSELERKMVELSCVYNRGDNYINPIT